MSNASNMPATRVYVARERVEEAKAWLRQELLSLFPEIDYEIYVGVTKQFGAMYVGWKKRERRRP